MPGTVAADYLTERGLPYVDVNNAADGFRMITQGTVDAIVYDAQDDQRDATRHVRGWNLRANIWQVVFAREVRAGVLLTGTAVIGS
ncbi:hypothetical protein AB4Y38_34545 [Paraburkholderia sp. EG285A]|uniref:hypothetical protein n=1 Tax=Paraburkholderia sp. EG285A TaxID=3237009 RepID=UPI0034D29F95